MRFLSSGGRKTACLFLRGMYNSIYFFQFGDIRMQYTRLKGLAIFQTALFFVLFVTGVCMANRAEIAAAVTLAALLAAAGALKTAAMFWAKPGNKVRAVLYSAAFASGLALFGALCYFVFSNMSFSTVFDAAGIVAVALFVVAAVWEIVLCVLALVKLIGGRE